MTKVSQENKDAFGLESFIPEEVPDEAISQLVKSSTPPDEAHNQVYFPFPEAFELVDPQLEAFKKIYGEQPTHYFDDKENNLLILWSEHDATPE